MYYTVLFLPLVAATVDINLICKLHLDDPTVNFKLSGSEVDIATDADFNSFGLNNDKIKECAQKYMGRYPDDIFLHSPTPWNDLYKIYKWKQVERHLVPISGKILSILVEPEEVLQQYFGNRSDKPSNYSIVLYKSVENKASSSWNGSEVLSAKGEIDYDIKIEDIRRHTLFSFASPWGRDMEKTEAVTVGSKAPWKILLEPGQVAKAILMATKGVINVEMEFKAFLKGDVAINYHPAYYGHHFWAPNMDQIMEVCNMTNSVTFKQVLSMELYSSPRIELVDLKSKKNIGEFFF